MPRSEENRCLHCGSRLPLIRKLRDGQFCSAAHRKSYLADQQKLALERLSAASLHNLAAATAAEPEPEREMAADRSGGGRRAAVHGELPPKGDPPSGRPPGRAPFFGEAPDAADPEACAPALPWNAAHLLLSHLERRAVFAILRRDEEIRDHQVETLPLASSVEIFEPLLASRPECGPAPAGLMRDCRPPEAAGARPALADPAPLAPEFFDLPLPPTPRTAAWPWAERPARKLVHLPPVAGDRRPFVRIETTEPSDRPAWASLRARSVAVEWDWMELVPPHTQLARLSPGAGSGRPGTPAAVLQAEPWAAAAWRPALRTARCGTLTGAGRVVVSLAALAVRAGTRRPDSGVAPLPAPPAGPAYPVRQERRELRPAEAAERRGFLPAPRDGRPRAAAAPAEPFAGFILRPVRNLAPALPPAKAGGLRPGFPVRNPYVPAPRAVPLRPASRPEPREIPAPLVSGWIRIQTRAQMQGAEPVLRVELHTEPFPLQGSRPRVRLEPAAVEMDPRARIPAAARTRGEAQPMLAVHAEPGERRGLRGLTLAGFWTNAPRDLKMMTLSLPLLLLLAIKPSLPKVAVAAPGDLELRKTLQTQWGAVQQNISSRAGIEYSDDFRAGLDQWESRGDLTAEWAYDAAGFVHPGPLAIFRPTLGLQNYSAEFLGMVDQRALGFVFRAADLDNYQAVKLVVLRAGPLPTIGLVRYAVIHGKAEEAKSTVLPITVRRDTLYRVRVDVRDEHFAVTVQGTLVDFWSDGRLRTGGIGFFAGKGEESRVRWVQVSHQYDALGRLCAFLAPYNLQAGNGSFKP